MNFWRYFFGIVTQIAPNKTYKDRHVLFDPHARDRDVVCTQLFPPLASYPFTIFLNLIEI